MLLPVRIRWYAQGRASANDGSRQCKKKYFAEDSSLAHYYNNILSDGKWNHMMDQTHIG
jgi:hypothetical protein